jgi:hypothetical protein
VHVAVLPLAEVALQRAEGLHVIILTQFIHGHVIDKRFKLRGTDP